MIKLKLVSTKPIFKNNRYKLLYSGSNYYLIDKDKSWFAYIFFGLNWLIPQEVYTINKDIADDLMVQRTDVKQGVRGYHILMVIMIMIFNIASPYLLNTILLSKNVKYSQLYEMNSSLTIVPTNSYIFLMLLITFVPALIIRVSESFRLRKLMMKCIKYNQFPVIKIKIIPTSMSVVIRYLGAYFLFVLLIILSGYLLIVTEGDWIISLCFMLLSLFFLLTNRLSINADKYKISESR
ncbi:DUF443 family protein [Enterococcus wangshanyuanii]|uniref:Tandem five-TM protein n=1 Tax=Enterococcus wangshanyuanii TaxID=2005703 RepID=A0ABQ1NJ34_9ENTE|nr:DUF443 family protein [Enterococcus wangshanyuanii]GGC77832.1 hypothetical protein GCM10011573_04350 [Enterococcus wangshanyuanii]